MDSWETFDEELLPDRGEFYSNLKMKTSQVLIIDKQREHIKNFVIKI